MPLGDLAELIATGRTPPRAAYSDSQGLFLIKVGNLTGAGINWIARDRNFIDLQSAAHRRYHPGPRVQAGDLLLTSSAHSPLYIAKKVDIVTTVPSWVGGEASFVGEVMLVRTGNERLSAFMLLGFLRQPSVIAEIQRMVRGQTAHLHPDDIAELRIPQALLDAREEWKALEAVLREEAALNERLNELAWQQQRLSSLLPGNKSA
jgi:type I restriction enzyme M protein